MESWVSEEDKLVRAFKFNTFKEAWEFLQKVALIAEKENHHPEIYNVYNYVELKLTTHSAGNKITEKDYQLASLINSL